MTYSANSVIDITDYNSLVGGNPVATSGTLNAVWATGNANAGYGQSAEANVSANTTIAASNWANLINKTANAATHQNSSITAITAPSANSATVFYSALSTNLTTIFTNRLNAVSQSSTTANSVTRGTTWTQAITFTHTATFANGNAARYFFNSGGQLAITVSHANTAAGINLAFNQMCTNVGTVVLSSVTSGTANIAGTLYNGITKIGGGAPGSTTISTNTGYYALTTANSNVFTQTASTAPSGYLSTFIRVILATNGANLAGNGDNGNVITIYTVWDEVPNGLTVGSGSITTLTVRPPEVTNISNTWGTITLAGSVAGS